MNIPLIGLIALAAGLLWFFVRSQRVKMSPARGPRETALSSTLYKVELRDRLIDLHTKLGSGEIDQQEYDRRRQEILNEDVG